MTKRGFVLTADYGLASDMVARDAKDVLTVGSRIVVNRLLDIGPNAQIACGENGTVDYVDPETSTVWILMDQMHYGLAEWRNHIWLVPFDTDDILGDITLYAGHLLPYVDCAFGCETSLCS